MILAETDTVPDCLLLIGRDEMSPEVEHDLQRLNLRSRLPRSSAGHDDEMRGFVHPKTLIRHTAEGTLRLHRQRRRLLRWLFRLH